jgi:hypothetical protein
MMSSLICLKTMQKTATELAAMVMLNRLTLDEIPENRQRTVQWLIRRCGVEQTGDEVALVAGLMRRVEGARRV